MSVQRDPFAFKADQEVDWGSVTAPQPGSFLEIVLKYVMQMCDCNSSFYLWSKKKMRWSAQLVRWWLNLGVTDLFGVEISLVVTGHVLRHGEEAHLQGDSPLDYFLQRISSMGTKLARMAMHRKRHRDDVTKWPAVETWWRLDLSKKKYGKGMPRSWVMIGPYQRYINNPIISSASRFLFPRKIWMMWK